MHKTKFVVFLVLALVGISACTHTREMQTDRAAAPGLDRIVQRGELVVGTAGSIPPLNMTTTEGEIIGLEPDLAKMMSNAMGVKLRMVPMPFADLLPAIEAGKVDMVLSDVTITGKRNLKVAFVGPYFISGKSFLTKRKTLATLRNTGEINNPKTRLVAVKGSTGQIFVERMIPNAKLVLAEDHDEAVDMVRHDEVDALIADYPACMVASLREPFSGLFAGRKPITYEPIGVALPGNDPLLINWVANFLNTISGSGKLKALTERWFKDSSWLKRLPKPSAKL